MCAAASGGGFDIHRQRKRLLAPISFMLHQCSPLCYKPHCSLTQRHTVHAHTQPVDIQISLQRCLQSHTSSTTATIPELSHMMYHSDSPYHTVVTTIFIVFLTVRLSIYPIKLKLSSHSALLLSFRLIYLFGHMKSHEIYCSKHRINGCRTVRGP